MTINVFNRVTAFKTIYKAAEQYNEIIFKNSIINDDKMLNSQSFDLRRCLETLVGFEKEIEKLYGPETIK